MDRWPPGQVPGTTAGDRQMVCCAAVPWAARPRPHVASSQGNVDIQGAGNNIHSIELLVQEGWLLSQLKNEYFPDIFLGHLIFTDVM